jgi:hypothetical protein
MDAHHEVAMIVGAWHLNPRFDFQPVWMSALPC